jgi:hypothetical protein
MHAYMKKFLTNKWVLNAVYLIALFNMIGYIVLGNIHAVFYFILLAILTKHFSKNMIIVLGIPLLVTNLLAVKGNIIEGMETKEQAQSQVQTQGQTQEQPTSEEQKKINKIVNKPDKKTGQGLIMQPLDDAPTDDTNTDNDAQTTGGEQQGFEPGRRKNKGHEIDYATTIEDAYDELNNILGSDGIQRLTSDTQNLMKQQMQLAEAMNNMTPMIQSIAPMVKNLQGMMGQMTDGKNGLEGIMGLAKQFQAQDK